jgi:hypothetical protein
MVYYAGSNWHVMEAVWVTILSELHRLATRRKVLVACLLGQCTTAGNPRIAQRLAMGHSGSASRLMKVAAKHPPTMRELTKMFKLL